jgi:hypothetical protein
VLDGFPQHLKSNPDDAVMTPEWAAKDIVDYFKPSGRILDPCRGGGSFWKQMPGADWCEISEGRDFFEWRERVDWIVSNPPFSDLHDWMLHSLQISENIVYLIPLWKYFGSYALMKAVNEYGSIKHIRVYGTDGKLKFPLGNTVGAVLWSRGFRGDTGWSWYAV